MPSISDEFGTDVYQVDELTECQVLRTRIEQLEHAVDYLLHSIGLPSPDSHSRYECFDKKKTPRTSRTSLTECEAAGSPSTIGSQKKVFADKFSMSSSTRQTLLESVEDIKLEESLWDVGVLMFVSGGDGFTVLEKIVSMFLVILNMVLQVTFVVAVFTTMSVDPYDETTLSTILAQRLMENHQLGLIDPQTHRTRAKLLCEGEIHNMLGETMNEVSAYLLGGEAFGIPGVFISLIAMYIWVLTMLVELRRASDLGLAVVSLPHPPIGSKSVMTYGDDLVHGGVVDKMSIFGKVTLLFVQVLPRLGIAGFLIFGGQAFLASSTNVADLVLNACALEVVRELDELLYAALMTKHSKKVVLGTTVRPDLVSVCKGWLVPEVADPNTHEAAFKSAQMNMFVRIAMGLLLVLAGYLLYLKPTVDHAHIASDYICGNNLNFAYANHPSGMPFFTDVDGESTNQKSLGLQCYFDAVSDMIRMRARFDPEVSPKNETLVQLVSGMHPRCVEGGEIPIGPRLESNRLACPSAKYAAVLDEIATANYFTSKFCRDNDVSFLVLRTTCLAKPVYAENTPMISLLASRESCSAAKDLCTCPRHCSPVNVPIVEGIRLDFDFMQMFQKICPVTCEVCEKEQLTSPPPRTNLTQRQPP